MKSLGASRIALVVVLSWTQISAQSGSLIDAELVQSTVESVAQIVGREYMDERVAASVETALRRGLADGAYARVTTREALANALTRDLFATTKDKHLVVELVPEPLPGAPRASSESSRPEGVRRTNGGIQRVEILPGNVGYLNLTAFWRPDEARDAIATAMHLLRQADALIIDMRANTGGSPDTVALLVSYLFEAPGLPLFEIVYRGVDVPSRYATQAPPVSDRDERRPTYVLTSTRTFSGGEGLAFLLQERRRAEVVGEVTAGAANAGRPHPVNAQFEVTVPNGRVRSAVSGGNWEGVGVKPDVAVPEGDALRVAHMRALRQLLQATPPGAWHDRLERAMQLLDKQGL